MELFQYDFMQRALIAGLITALVCPVVGLFVVVRRQSLIGDGLGHIAFAGITSGYLLGFYPFFMAALVTAGGALGIEWLRRRQRHFSDMALAIFFYAGVAMAIIFSSMTKMPTGGILSFLFGSIITVTQQDLLIIGLCSALVLIVVVFLFKPFILIAFDEDAALIAGLPVEKLGYLFSLLTALVVVVGMTVVGILLVSALMIVPVASALLYRQSFRRTMVLAVLYSLSAVLTGLILSFYLNIAPGGTIVMSAILLYILTSLCHIFPSSRI